MSTPEPPAAPALPDAPEPSATESVETPVVPSVPETQAGSTTEGRPLPVVSNEPAPIAEARRRAIDEEGGVHQPRTDDDAILNQFVTIVEGPYAGRYAVYQQTLTSGEDGYPETVLVRTRDDRDESLVVDYSHLRPAAPGGR